MQLRHCKYCNQSKVCIKTDIKDSSRNWKYIDKYGSHWHRSMCPDCIKSKKRKDNQIKYGYGPLAEVENHLQKKGRESELKAKEYFLNKGYKVIHTNGKGPDLIIKKGSLECTVEVKTVIKLKKVNCFWVNSVYPTRMNDTFIAYVYKDHVVCNSMEKHLALKNGKATVVTEFFKDKIYKKTEKIYASK